ncbi:MAG TPA: cytochrome c biogenesis protein CcsA, partial [Bryobacteraceae bacterium]
MREKIFYILGAVALAILIWNINTIAPLPAERQQGVVFKIIFFHVPLAFAAIIASVVSLVASVLFLITRNFKYDAVAVAVTEVGLAVLAGNLVTGSIWGRQAWGIWWTWDARLTSALVCWLLYA